MNRLIFLGVLCIAFFTGTLSGAQPTPLIGRPGEPWKTIKTEHFDVIVSAQQHDLGLYYAYAAEKAYRRLATVFSNPTDRVVLIINDTTDVTNGYATRIPYPHIMAYTVPVGEHDSLSEAGDWARELITHELTHILQFEPATGFYSVLRPVFGSIVAPNLLMPLWWKEGMAVEMETQFTPRGRLRSTYQDAMIRGFVLENTLSLYTLPQANEALSTWPYGSRPYIFGSLFFSQLNDDTHDVKSTGFLVKRQGERLPYFIETPMQELVQRSYETQYTAALDAAGDNARTQLRALRSRTPSVTEAVPQENLASFLPVYSPRYRLLAFIENVDGKNRVTVKNENGETLKLRRLPEGEILSLDFHPAEKKILYTKIEKTDSNHIYSDLYIYDLDLEKSEKLTTAQRARSARYSDDGQRAVFVTTFGGQTQLRLYDFRTKAVTFLINSTLANRYESPLLWDEGTVLAAKADGNGDYRLVRLDLATKVETELPLRFRQQRFLRKAGGALYFVSSENGVNNLYVSRDLATAAPVSHLLTGVWSYDLAPGGRSAWASLMTGSGFKVTRVELAAAGAPLPPLPVIRNAIAERYTYAPDSPAAATTEAPVRRPLTVTDYEAGPYLWPSYWIPFVSTGTSSRGIFLMAQTTGHDPLNRHMYALSASYDSDLNRGNFSGLYLNSTLTVPFQLSSLVNSRALGTANDIVQTTTHAFALLPDMFALSKNLRTEFGVQLQETDYLTVSQHWGPYLQLSYLDYEQTLFQISPESGWGGLLKQERNLKLRDETDFVARDYDKTTFTLVGFASPGLPRRHALKAQLSGLWTSPDVFARYGVSSMSAFYEQDLLLPQFVARGYAPAQFYGAKMWNFNLEYRFPITDLDTGSGTDPYFLKRLSGAIVTDGLGVEGAGLEADETTVRPLRLNESIWSTGAEFHLETTLGYILPVNFVLGYYLPHSPVFASGGQLGITLQIGGF